MRKARFVLHRNKTYFLQINLQIVTKEEIQERIDEILADERLSYKTATIFENAVLALIQQSLEIELRTLQRVLGVEITNITQLRGE